MDNNNDIPTTVRIFEHIVASVVVAAISIVMWEQCRTHYIHAIHLKTIC